MTAGRGVPCVQARYGLHFDATDALCLDGQRLVALGPFTDKSPDGAVQDFG